MTGNFKSTNASADVTSAPVNKPGRNIVLLSWGIVVILIAALVFAYIGYRTNPTDAPTAASYKGDTR